MIHGEDDDAGQAILHPDGEESRQRAAVENLVAPLGEIVPQLAMGDDARRPHQRRVPKDRP
jgi:hypothetical protein